MNKRNQITKEDRKEEAIKEKIVTLLIVNTKTSKREVKEKEVMMIRKGNLKGKKQDLASMSPKISSRKVIGKIDGIKKTVLHPKISAIK